MIIAATLIAITEQISRNIYKQAFDGQKNIIYYFANVYVTGGMGILIFGLISA